RFQEAEFENFSKTVEDFISKEQILKLEQVLKSEFSPGSLIRDLDLYALSKEKIFKLIHSVIDYSKPVVKASFGEGFWSDHFTYNLDLIEDYLKIYPEKCGELLLKRRDYGIYQSPERVLPRSKKIGLRKDGQVRQYGALEKRSSKEGEWLKDQEGHLVYTHLLDKLLLVIVNKYCSLDAAGIGIEMEGNKPGWNDAMNGLPGLLGSGVGESVELLRIVRFVREALLGEAVEEIDLLKAISEVLKKIEDYQKKKKSLTDFEQWELRSKMKEEYREQTGEFISQERSNYLVSSLIDLLRVTEMDLEKGIEKAIEENQGILPTYLSFEVNKFEKLGHKTPYGLEAIRIQEMTYRYLPNFLEAPARYLKVTDEEKARESYKKIRNSKLYDSGIQMYVTSVPLDEESMEIGRIRAFTPGWLERESVFLHMIYKYLLGLMKSGLWEEFYQEIKTHGIPFLNPEIYGRATYENSSFIASSRNPDPEVVGQGFVARLSGSTIEALSMWQMLFVGKEWFCLKNEQLYFSFEPNLSVEWFDEESQVSFNFLTKTKVTYHNPERRNLYGSDRQQAKAMTVDGIPYKNTFFMGEEAERLRRGEIKEVHIFY
ncbi:MAG: cellobiose phosphorylase, partial [Vallitaleaceae bacterium]|nr:cellobiose phosphorylase [Vallitaleaceae bacterium]